MKRVIWAILLISGSLSAQSFTASIRGVVTDQSHSIIPEAKITATDVSRNLQFNAKSDDQGRYTITNLQPGTYSLAVEAQGFNRYVRSGFDLQVQQQATIDVELPVGQIASTVEVKGATPLLNTTSATLGQVVTNRSVVSLPVASRQPLALVALTAGVTPVNISSGGQTNTNFVANGTRNSTADVLMDGMSLTNIEQNSGITNLEYQPSVDVVEEFKVQTNFFSAEFGNTGGSIVNLISKSGTNNFHGTLYEFHRNSALNANNWFSNRAGKSIPDFTRNVFGGVIGGPVLLPKLYDGRNRTFFLFDYEGTRQSNATTSIATIPTLEQRAGDFSNLRNQDGQVISIYNPFDTYVDAGGKTLRRPFAGNKIPASLLSPIALSALSYYPDPTSDGDPFTHNNNFFGQGVQQSLSHQMDAKIDHVFSEKQRIMSRYSVNWGNSTPANLFGNVANPFTNGSSRSRTQNFVFDYTRVQSPTTVLQLRYGVLRQSAYTTPQSFGFDQTSLGLPAVYNTSGINMFPAFQPDGYQMVGTRGWALIGRGDDVQSVTASMTKVWNAHNLKIGAEGRFMRLNYLQPGYPQGNFNFNRGITNQDPNGSNSLQGDSVASMLLGWGSGGDYHLDPWSASASQYFGVYLQDDWKITRKLTLNLGLRYDFDVPRTERYNRYTWFNFTEPSPIAGLAPGFPDLKGRFHFADADTRSPVNADYNNAQPRFGFAYAATPKTAIRGAYGIFYTVSRASIKGHLGTGFSTNSNPQFSRDGNLTQYASLSNPYPNGLTLPLTPEAGASAFLGLPFGTDTRANMNPQYQQWNFSIQRQLPGNSILEIVYSGSKGTHLYFGGGTENLDLLSPTYWGLGRTALNARVDNPFYGVITDTKSVLSQPTVTLNTLLRPYPQYAGNASRSTPNIGNSIYHSGIIRYEKQFSSGLSLLAHYTWSKLIDDASFSAGNVAWLGGPTSVQDPFNLRAERSLSAMDITHRAVLTFDYLLPFGRGKAIGSNLNRWANALVGGWEISGISTFSSGYPIVPSLQGGVLWNGAQRPNLTGDPAAGGSIEDRLNQFFNPASFSRPVADTFGTAPRTLNYRTPGIKNLDASLFKNVQFTESKRLQLRLEAYNVTNTPTFGAPNAQYGSSSFGVITGYAGGRGPRELQVAVKFYY